jgi:hypothetical protein
MQARYMHILQIVYAYVAMHMLACLLSSSAYFISTCMHDAAHRQRYFRTSSDVSCSEFYLAHVTQIAVATGRVRRRHASRNQWIVRAISVYLKLVGGF